MAFDEQWLLLRLFTLPPLLMSLVVHEYAHARTALAFGDHSAMHMGRLTLNPLAHLDPLGTLCIALVGFGWAKPVPVNPLRLSPRRLGDIAVSLAGPMSNLFLAIAAGLLMRAWYAWAPAEWAGLDSFVFAYFGWIATVNCLLFVFNLLPLFPLDGHHIARELLPISSQDAFMNWQRRFGAIMLMALLFGPRLLGAVTGRADLPDPLGWILFHVQSALMAAVAL